MSATQTLPVPLLPPAAPAPAAAFPVTFPVADVRAASARLAQIATLVLWLACLGIGFLGFVLPYARPQAPVRPPEPVVVEKLEVALTREPPPPAAAAPAVALDAPPPPAALAPAAPARPVAVAEPSAVAFAVPVDGPTFVVDAASAAHSRPGDSQTAAAGDSSLPAPQTLVFGQGEGRQPAPEYPASAMNRHEQGVVGVRFVVTPDGRVRDAVVAAPSAWPVLDESAVRTVRHRWHFARGSVRVYEVAIRFILAE